MANEPADPRSNKQQFFITLDSCDWLNGKHTIFGKVRASPRTNRQPSQNLALDADLTSPQPPLFLLCRR